MPKLGTSMAVSTIGGSNFKFTGARIEELGATEYTLVTIAVDETGSVAGFADELLRMLQAAVESCRLAVRRVGKEENVLIRVIAFGSQHPNGVRELHGFKPISEIDVAAYQPLMPGGLTPLCDACYSSLGAMNTYAQNLVDNDYAVNAILFVITDGGENASVATMNMVKTEADKAVRGEVLESMISILIGVNAQMASGELAQFRREAGLTQYIDAGDASPRTLAKLGQFVSRSVSSQSQALGTGGPSKQISATI